MCATGDAKYFSSDLDMLAVANGQLFGNSIYVGANTINNQVFYTLLILPEALFNGVPLTPTNNTLSIYSTIEIKRYKEVHRRKAIGI